MTPQKYGAQLIAQSNGQQLVPWNGQMGVSPVQNFVNNYGMLYDSSMAGAAAGFSNFVGASAEVDRVAAGFGAILDMAGGATTGGGFLQSRAINIAEPYGYKEIDLIETNSLMSARSPLGIEMINRPGSIIRNAMSEAEYVQAQEIVGFKGGNFEGAPTSNFAGIDGWLDGTPVQLKIVTGKSHSVIHISKSRLRSMTYKRPL